MRKQKQFISFLSCRFSFRRFQLQFSLKFLRTFMLHSSRSRLISKFFLHSLYLRLNFILTFHFSRPKNIMRVSRMASQRHFCSRIMLYQKLFKISLHLSRLRSYISQLKRDVIQLLVLLRVLRTEIVSSEKVWFCFKNFLCF